MDEKIENTTVKRKRLIKEKKESKMVLTFLAWTMMIVWLIKIKKIPEEEHDSEKKRMHSVLDTLSSEC